VAGLVKGLVGNASAVVAEETILAHVNAIRAVLAETNFASAESTHADQSALAGISVRTSCEYMARIGDVTSKAASSGWARA